MRLVVLIIFQLFGSNSCLAMPPRLPIHLAVMNKNEMASDVGIRLYLVRHAEAVANRDKIAAGQMESPLTEKGIEQAKALGKALEDVTFSKIYVSDMERTQHTARLILPSSNFKLDPRLREMAKGAREGFLKAMSYEEALLQRKKRGEADVDIPLLESNDDVYCRVINWLDEIIREAIAELNGASDSARAKKFQRVVAVTHAGVIRTLCAKLVPSQMPASVDITNMGRDSSDKNHLFVPNTSITIFDFSINNDLKDSQHISDTSSIKLKALTWCDHLITAP